MHCGTTSPQKKRENFRYSHCSLLTFRQLYQFLCVFFYPSTFVYAASHYWTTSRVCTIFQSYCQRGVPKKKKCKNLVQTRLNNQKATEKNGEKCVGNGTKNIVGICWRVRKRQFYIPTLPTSLVCVLFLLLQCFMLCGRVSSRQIKEATCKK